MLREATHRVFWQKKNLVLMDQTHILQKFRVLRKKCFLHRDSIWIHCGDGEDEELVRISLRPFGGPNWDIQTNDTWGNTYGTRIGLIKFHDKAFIDSQDSDRTTIQQFEELYYCRTQNVQNEIEPAHVDLTTEPQKCFNSRLRLRDSSLSTTF